MISMMGKTLLRFPHLGTQIFESLDDSNLAKSRKVARSWLNFIDSEEMPWKRILQVFPCKEGQTKLLVALITGQKPLFPKMKSQFFERGLTVDIA